MKGYCTKCGRDQGQMLKDVDYWCACGGQVLRRQTFKAGVFENTYTPKFSKGQRGIDAERGQITICDVDTDDMLYLYKFLYDDGTRSKALLGHIRDMDQLYAPWRAGARLLDL